MHNYFKIFRLIKNIPKTSWSSNKTLNIKPKIKTLLFLIFGLFLFGLGETLLLATGAGVSPWTVLAEGLSVYTSYSIGICTFWTSLSVLLFWIPLKQKPGIGTILNAIIIALVFDFANQVTSSNGINAGDRVLIGLKSSRTNSQNYYCTSVFAWDYHESTGIATSNDDAGTLVVAGGAI